MIALLMLATTPTLAAPPPASPHEALAHERISDALEEIDATEPQQQRVREIFSQHRAQLQALRTEAAALREEIRDAFVAEILDRERIMALRVEAVDLFDRATETATETMIEIAELFTPEQRATLAELRAARIRERFSLRMQ